MLVNKIEFYEMFYKFYIWIFIFVLLMIAIFTVIKFVGFTKEKYNVVYKNEYVDKNNGDTTYLNNQNIREIIISNYKNILNYNYILFVYFGFNIILLLYAIISSDVIVNLLEEYSAIYCLYKYVILVINNTINVFIGIFHYFFTKTLDNKQKKYIQDNGIRVNANSI